MCSMTLVTPDEVRIWTLCLPRVTVSESRRRLTLLRAEFVCCHYDRVIWLIAACIFAPGCTISPTQPVADKQSSSPSAVALHVERRGGDLRVSWDRHMPLVARASNGVLFIEDGDLPRREVRLNAEDLHSGGVLYVPSTETVQFRLSIGVAESTASLTGQRDANGVSSRTRSEDNASTREGAKEMKVRAQAREPLSFSHRAQPTPAAPAP
jgi:hypothetical protein